MSRRAAGAGFTLLEVLVAIAILGLGMTAILSAQTGLFASSSYAERVSLATGMVRCKMSEVELKLVKDGYPLGDQSDEGPCCADETTAGYHCSWKVQKVELPQPPTSTDLSSKLGPGAAQSSLGSLGAIAAVGQSNGSILGQSPGLGDMSKVLAGQAPGAGADPGSSGFGASSFGSQVPGTSPIGSPPPGGGGLMPGSPMGGTSSLAPLVMSLVYPTLKPMLEASIRKLVVKVEWQQGGKTRDLEIVQFVTNPMQGGLDPNAAAGLEGAATAITGLLGGAAQGAAAQGAAAPAAGSK